MWSRSDCMAYRTLSVAVLASIALQSCQTAPPNVAQALNACGHGASSIEVRDAGVVVRVLGNRNSQSGVHEGFIVRVPTRSNDAHTRRNMQTLRVEDNVDITGPIPLGEGSAIQLQGQLECDDYVIHWTHHDPRGRHMPGYISVDGKTYQ
jgi:Protein of unknown function (DUF3465)